MIKRLLPVFFAVLAWASALAAGIALLEIGAFRHAGGADGVPDAPDATGYNVIIISADTLRADHLSLYGYERNTAPALSQFAGDAAVFERAISQAPYTLSSHASMQTSQYPSVQGPAPIKDRSTVAARIFPSQTTLAQAIRPYGYATAAFVGNGELHEGTRMGLEKGFDEFPLIRGSTLKDAVFPEALRWLDARRPERFYMLLQGFDVHAPYHGLSEHAFGDSAQYDGPLSDHDVRWFDYSDKDSPAILHRIFKEDLQDGTSRIVLDTKQGIEELGKEDIQHIVDHYDGNIKEFDIGLGTFFDELKERGLWENTVIFVLSGHGTMLGDGGDRLNPLVQFRGIVRRGLIGHGDVYDGVVRVPLVIRHPDIDASRIPSQIQLLDIYPTILDALGIPQSSKLKRQIQGVSLMPLMRGEGEGSPFAYGEGDPLDIRFVRTPEWKFIIRWDDVVELFHVSEDPEEIHNVSGEYPDVVRRLREQEAAQRLENLHRRAEHEEG